MADIFFSYKREDREKVRPLVAALRANGLDTWWDEDIAGGQRWRDTIVRELDAARLCVVAWSEWSVGEEGRYVCEEAERSAGRGAYLGVLVDKVSPPFGFAEWQAIDLSGWIGAPDDPRLADLIDTIRARLDGKAVPTRARTPVAAPKRGGRQGRLAVVVAGLLLIAVVAAGLWLALRGRGAGEAASPSDFVVARLADFPCAWLQISRYEPAPGGAYVALQGIAAAPESIQTRIISDAAERSVPIGELDVADVATAPPATCAELELLRRHMRAGRSRLTVLPQAGSLERTNEGTFGYVEYELDYGALPEHSALLGLDSAEGVHVVISDLRAHRTRERPVRTQGSRATYGTIWEDTDGGTANVGLILMTASAPIDLRLVDAIGTRADRPFMERLNREAQAQGWQFELGLVPCGFEASQQQRC